MNKLCEYSNLVKNGLEIYLECKKTNCPCAFTRYCITDQCLKMLNSYTNCIIRNKE